MAERMGLIPELSKAGKNINPVAFVTEKRAREAGWGRKVLKRALGDRFVSIQRGDLANAIYQMVASCGRYFLAGAKALE